MLLELGYRDEIKEAKRIANPGCYATAAALSIHPLKDHLIGPPNVFGISGYSGAGTKPSPRNDIKALHDNLMPYSLTEHIHEKEVSHRLEMPINLFPHVGQWYQGITLTINLPLKKAMTSRDVRAVYQKRYSQEPLINVISDIPQVKNISGKHGVEIGGFASPSSLDRIVLVATIDNLLKG